MAKKKIEDKVYDCTRCTNSFFVKKDGYFHCSTKIKDRDIPLTENSRVETCKNCSWYKDR